MRVQSPNTHIATTAELRHLYVYNPEICVQIFLFPVFGRCVFVLLAVKPKLDSHLARQLVRGWIGFVDTFRSIFQLLPTFSIIPGIDVIFDSAEEICHLLSS